MDFPMKSYLTRKIRHFEKNENIFSWILALYLVVTFCQKSRSKIFTQPLKVSMILFAIILWKFSFYQTLQKLSNWNILHQYICLIKSLKKCVKHFFLCLSFWSQLTKNIFSEIRHIKTCLLRRLREYFSLGHLAVSN